ncbi:12857_t:CDS:2 [Entrophospora sp. SA101]|nr:12857_t:CDS:2 [Entrophospora sp. SA101]
MIDASNKVAELYGKGEYCSRCIHRWAKICLEGKHISLSLSGKFSSKSFLHDELVSLQVSSYLHSKKFKVSPMLVKKYFEEHILPVLHIEVPFTISVRTAACWMNKLGFYYKQYKKGIYFDGHNCEDVCKIRTLPTLELGEKEHVWITHDESTFHTYDGPRAVWGKKGLGQGIHVSDFLTETIGPLKDDTGEARVTMVLGANWDGYWNENKWKKVVILIDEYDSPLLSVLDNTKETSQAHIKFLLITGVTMFSHVSLFSGANILNDLTISPVLSGAYGFTNDEIKQTFGNLLDKFGSNKQEFLNYWIQKGKTSLLAKLISIEHVKDIADEIKINENSIVPVSIADIQKSSTFPVLLFFQTGYLTIKQQEGTNLVLEIPNTEVCESLMGELWANFDDTSLETAFNQIKTLTDLLKQDKFKEFLIEFNKDLGTIPYNTTKL